MGLRSTSVPTMPQEQTPDSSASILPEYDIPQMRYIELPPRHPVTNSLCDFDDSAAPEYPRNSYDIPPPIDIEHDECFWPDGLNELDPRPRNLSENCRKALRAGIRNRFLHGLITGSPGDYRPEGEKSICREWMYRKKRQEIRKGKAKENVEVAEERVRKSVVEKEAKKEFKHRRIAHSRLKEGLVFEKMSKCLKELILSDFEVTEEEIAERKLLRPWAESTPNQHSTRRPTICYSPPDPEEVRKENLKKKNEHDAAMKLYVMWEDSPLGVPDAEGSEGKMWEDYMKQERRGGLKAGERR